jgi:hypothetical protein
MIQRRCRSRTIGILHRAFFSISESVALERLRHRYRAGTTEGPPACLASGQTDHCRAQKAREEKLSRKPRTPSRPSDLRTENHWRREPPRSFQSIQGQKQAQHQIPKTSANPPISSQPMVTYASIDGSPSELKYRTVPAGVKAENRLDCLLKPSIAVLHVLGVERPHSLTP